jgi:hypothetical protein
MIESRSVTSFSADIDRLDWQGIAGQLDAEGYALLPGLMAPDLVQDLAGLADVPGPLRRVSLGSGDVGRGELFYFDEALPDPWRVGREAFYRHLVAIANRWSELMGSGYVYPAGLDDFLQRNRQAGQARPQSHLSRLGAEDYLALQQRNDGEHVFPLQVVALLSAPGKDFQGGEFVMTEQRPRMQSRPMVLPLRLGDVAIIGTAERPFKGSSGHYRVNLKHAVSHVRSGERIGMELSFHHAR